MGKMKEYFTKQREFVNKFEKYFADMDKAERDHLNALAEERYMRYVKEG